jgi:hypothetical protein
VSILENAQEVHFSEWDGFSPTNRKFVKKRIPVALPTIKKNKTGIEDHRTTK